jgi:prolyl 4-hydroxylase
MVKVRHSRLQAIKLSTFTLVSSMLFMLTFVLLVLLGLGIFSLRSSSEGFPPNDLSSYRRMTSER